MLIDYIKTGDRVEITAQTLKHDVKPYVSKVEAVINYNTVLIHAPVSMGALIRLPEGEHFHLHFISDNGVFNFRAKVDALFKVDDFDVVRLILLDRGERSQRRDFFRFRCSIPIKFAVVNKEDGEDMTQLMLDGLIVDLGGGGMKMYSAEALRERAFLRVMLELNETYIMVFGEVLHKVIDRGGALPYQYGIKFTAMSKSDQEKIIKYLYNEQRKLLQGQNIMVKEKTR